MDFRVRSKRHYTERSFNACLESLKGDSVQERLTCGTIGNTIVEHGFVSSFRVDLTERKEGDPASHVFTAPYTIGFNGGLSEGIEGSYMSVGDKVCIERVKSDDIYWSSRWCWFANLTTNIIYELKDWPV